jgi:phenylacetate-coenzyme A ligase PaaK-like adenylate-forming protein
MWQTARLITKGIAQKIAAWRGPDRLQALQRRRLRDLVAHAKAHSPFHAERLNGVDPESFHLADLPTLTKPIMMDNFDGFVTDPRLKRADLEAFMSDPARLGQLYLGEFAPSRTSGTQGIQAIIVQNRRMLETLFAIQMTRGTVFSSNPLGIISRMIRRARLAVVTIGRGFFPSAAALAYAPKASRNFVNRLWLQHIEPLGNVVEQLNAFGPNILLAYANVLEMLAREALDGRLELPRLRQVINMSEPLSDGARGLAQRAFGLPITNNYATGECMALSTGCPVSGGMHLQADWAILEVVDRHNRPVPAGTPGEKVLLTNLYNTLQPFIRYEIGDVVTMSPTPCPCGSPLPLILKVEGRSDEVIWIRGRNGYEQVHPYVLVDFLDECPEVGWYQFVQTERNRVVLRASAAPGRRVAETTLRAVVDRGLKHFRLDGVLEVDIQITSDVAPNPNSGKLKRITSKIGPPPDLPAGRGAA